MEILKPLDSDGYKKYAAMAEYCNNNGLVIVENDEKYYSVKKSENLEETMLINLRTMREYECFNIINRGKFWYEMLTAQQVQELKEWYNAWLNVTVTKQVPQKPIWLV